MPTATTLPLLLLIVILWRITRGHVLAMVMFVSVFTAASAINVGNSGISPWLFTLCAGLVLKFFTRGYQPLRVLPGINRASVHLLLLFVIYTICSAVLFPWFFRGVMVEHETAITQLKWSFSNFAQCVFLLFSAVVYFLAVGSSWRELRTALDWYVRGCVMAGFIAMYQLASAIVHVPYPRQILYTNPTYVIYDAYKVAGVWRLNSTFCEASEMSQFLLVGIALLGWQLVTERVTLWRLTGFAVMILALMHTVSSLGYATFIIMGTLAAALFVLRVLRQKAISPARLLFVIAFFTGIVLAFVFAQSLVQELGRVLTAVLIEKQNSLSYRDRMETHVTALRILRDTHYFGAGWGSFRASGLQYILLGTEGIIGLTVFLALYASQFIPIFYQTVKTKTGSGRNLYLRSLFALSVLLISLFIAGSEPVMPILWALFGACTVSRLRVVRPAFRDTHAAIRAGRFLPFRGPRSLPAAPRNAS